MATQQIEHPSPSWAVTHDTSVALAHAVPHGVVSQLLLPDVAALLDPDAVRGGISAMKARAPSITKDEVTVAAQQPFLHRLDLGGLAATAWEAAELLRVFADACVAPAFIREIDLSSTNIDASAMRHLHRFGRIQCLDISNCSFVKSDCMRAVAQLGTLTSLNVSGCRKLDSSALQFITTLRHLSTLNIRCSDRVDDAALEPIGGLPSLTSLDMSHCNKVRGPGLAHLSRLGGTLLVLDLSFCEGIAGIGVLKPLGELQSLESLNLSHLNIDPSDFTFIGQMKSLTFLALRGCEEVEDGALSEVSGLPFLRELHLSGCRGITSAGIRHLGGLSALTSLSLNSCINITDSALEVIATLTRLETLNLSGCTALTVAGFKHMAASPYLTELYVHSSSNINGACVVEIAQLPRLRKLDLSGCSNVDEVGVEAIVAMRKPLAELVLCGCHNVVGDAVASLSKAGIGKIWEPYPKPHY